MPNPSEIQRMTEELHSLKSQMQGQSKWRKAQLLLEVRALERQLGVEGVNYNNSGFSVADNYNG